MSRSVSGPVKEASGGSTGFVVGSPEAFAPNTPVNQAEYRTYLAEAQLDARLGFSRRFSISIVGPDQPGLLAAVTRPISASGWNVEAASANVLANHTLLMITISANPPTAEKDVKRLLKDPQSEYDLELNVVSVELAPTTPLSAYLPWHLYAEVAERPGALHDVAAVLYKHRCWLTNFSTRIVSRNRQQRCVLDINLAVDPNGDLAALTRDVEDLRRTINGASQAPKRWEFRPVAAPTHLSTSTSDRAEGARFTLSVTGVAKPGLVANVTGALLDGGYNLVGSAMAILEERTALIMLLENADPTVHIAHLEASLSTVKADWRLEVFAKELDRPRQGRPSRSSTRTKLYHFYGVVPERPGVISMVADTLFEERASVVMMLARVIGSPAACVVNADVRVPERANDSTILARLTNLVGWASVAWEPLRSSQRQESVRSY